MKLLFHLLLGGLFFLIPHLNTIGNSNFLDSEGPTINVWYGDTQDFGVLGNPQEFYINILGNVSDPDGVSSLSYTIDGSSPVSLSVGPDGRRLENSGDFNVDLDWTTLSTGAHTLVISAEDGLGNVSSKNVTVNYTPGNVWPLPFSVDWSTLSTDGDPNTPDPTIHDVAQSVDGKWSVDGGLVRTVEPGYDRLLALGDILWDDYRVLVPITMHSTPGGFGTGVLFRWNGHTDSPVSCSQPKCGYLPLGAIAWMRPSGIEFYSTGVSESRSISSGNTYWMLVEVESNPSRPIYRMKLWEDGQSEPVDWDITHQESPSSPAAGSLLLISHQADASFGNVIITPVVGAPNVPPVATDDNVTVEIGTSRVINVLGNDSDSDGILNPASVNLVSPPSNGTITAIDPVNGRITYTHDGSITTTDSFSYNVEDNDGDVSNDAVVNLNISEDPVVSFLSDDFDGCELDQIWQFIDPSGDGSFDLETDGAGDAYLSIGFPAGTPHDVWGAGNESARIMQPALDQDFELEVKFVNEPQGGYNDQGILIEQNENNFLRFDVYNPNGSNLVLFSGKKIGGSTATTINSSVPLGTVNYLRVNRSGNTWTFDYSADGVNWSNSGSFDQALSVDKVGVFAANPVDGLQFNAEVDYFFNSASPIAPEDDELNTIDINITGNGAGNVTLDPDKLNYACGETVTIEAVPVSGSAFNSWSGDLSGSNSEETLVIDGPLNISADFILDSENCNLANVSVDTPPICNGDDAEFTVNFDIVNGSGEYAVIDLDNSNAVLASITSAASTASDLQITVSIPGPTTSASLNIDVWDVNDNNCLGGTPLGVSIPECPETAVQVSSDDFCEATIDTDLWTINEPAGTSIDLVGSGTSDALLRINVPGGSSHEMHETITAPHLLQSVDNDDLDIEVKFESSLEFQYQEQGILVKEDESNFLRCELYSSSSATNIYVRSYGSVASNYVAAPIGSNGLSSPIYMRLTRTGDDWNISYSFDGSFTDGGDFGFNHPMTVNGVGPYAGNAIGSGSPAFTGLVDYFFNSSAPIVNEDACSSCTDDDGDGLCNDVDQCPGFDDNLDSDTDSIADGCDICPGSDDLADNDADGVPDGCDLCEGSDDALDDDGDSIPNGCDQCPGFDDLADNDGDSVPDGCDLCEGSDDALDDDADGVPNGCDLCEGSADSLDDDSDGIPNGCDTCPGFDDVIDTDFDGVPDACDACPGSDDSLDDDNDGVANGCDLCSGFDDLADNDADGVPNGCDICTGSDDTIDSDADGVPNGCDICPGADDSIDTDADGIPDGCDLCPGFNDSVDSDSDGVPNGCDICPGAVDAMDADGDSVPDGCDICQGFNDSADSDADGVPDGCDLCPGFADSLDSDGDSIPNGCDACPGGDDLLDDDNDGVPDACDQCEGSDDALDDDGDGIPNGCDLCPGFDDLADNDADGVPNGCDICTGSDDTIDSDNDGIPDGCDICPGADDSLDTDADSIPDGCDLCPGFNDSVDSDADGVPDGCDVCPGSDDLLDDDNDGVPNGCDFCPGSDDNLDSDLDGVPDGCDICDGGDDKVDTDFDLVPDACDLCPGEDDSLDSDGDSIPDGCDFCPGFDDSADSDGDGIPDGCDSCPDGDDTVDSDSDGLADACDNCPLNANASQNDWNSDGIGDVCQDSDSDGLSDDFELTISGTDPGDSDSNDNDCNDALEWGQACGTSTSCPEDLNGDGQINTADLTALLALFGSTCE